MTTLYVSEFTVLENNAPSPVPQAGGSRVVGPEGRSPAGRVTAGYTQLISASQSGLRVATVPAPRPTRFRPS